MILYGGNEKFSVESKTLGVTRDYKIDFEGVANFIESQFKNSEFYRFSAQPEDIKN